MSFAGVVAGDGTGWNVSTARTVDVDVDCGTITQAVSCNALWNSSFIDAAEVTSEQTVVPDFDDDRLDRMCR